MSTEPPEVRFYEWEGGDGGGTAFDLDDVYEAFRYARANGLSVTELFDLFVFPSAESISNPERRRYELEATTVDPRHLGPNTAGTRDRG